MSRLVFGFMYLVHFLPLAGIAAIGNLAGSVLYRIIGERREVVRINLEKCFPGMRPRERERLARAHFRAFCRSFIERAILWWAPRERIQRLVRIEGREHLERCKGRPVILFSPHFVGLDTAISRLSMEYPLAGIYSSQKDPHFEKLMYRGRARFGVQLYPRHTGLRKSLRAMRAGACFYYLPDLDYGPRGSVFVPFFGVQAATVTGMSHIARATGATVIPVVTRVLPGGAGYVVRIYPGWNDYPTGDDVADARTMLAFIEERVLEMPEQYYWIHKRFKTRPQGERRFYQ